MAIALKFQLESGAGAPRAARTAVRPLETHLDSETLSDLLLVISELTTNAVTFGPGLRILVAVEVDPLGNVRGEVDDGGFRGVVIADADPVDAKGLGLLIVDSLTSDWGVVPDTSRVWFELPTHRGGGSRNGGGPELGAAPG